MPYSPLARGVLTGKYEPDAAARQGHPRRPRSDKRMMQTEWRPESLETRAGDQAACRGPRHHRRAVRGRLGAEQSSFVTGVIAGPRTEEQWDDYLRALDYRFTAEDEALIDRLVVTGHPSTPGFNDPGLSDRGAPAPGPRRRVDRRPVLDPDEAARRRDQLVELLQDAVGGGASIGFVLPLERGEAAAYWQGVIAGLREGHITLVAASERDRLVGSVQLGLEPRANGRHRAEVMKLMVRRSHRRRGIARSLLHQLRALAQGSGRTLLLLDVRTGDPAETLYRSLGFVRFGEVPRYALDPDGGRLAASSFYYLQLAAARSFREPMMYDRAELVAPSLRHARSYVAALHEGFRRGAQERLSERRISQIEADFATYVEADHRPDRERPIAHRPDRAEGAVLGVLAGRRRRVHRRDPRPAQLN